MDKDYKVMNENLSKFIEYLKNYLDNMFDKRLISFTIRQYDNYIKIEVDYILGTFVFG